jgi:NAD(P)-dependent dehydrogenase (short-subunit alcohol dehydrogenase family)
MQTQELRFDGQVAVITGAGRGLGRAYAALLAERGAKLVINDVGIEAHGSPPTSQAMSGGPITSNRPAESAATEIRSLGGEAVADYSDIADPAGGEALIRTALQAYGQIDILINNAGISWARPFEETDLDGFLLQWKVHVGGTINTTKAAWQHMAQRRFGRVINTTSLAAISGSSNQAEYAAAKGAIHGLTRTLALEGARLGIQVNAVAPVAMTRLVEKVMPKEWNDRARQIVSADLVSPLVIWLAHETCAFSGHIYQALGGRVAEVMNLEPRGLMNSELTPELVRDHFDEISATSDLKSGASWNAEIGEGLFASSDNLGLAANSAGP